jgi:hypothetical protein
MPMRRSDEKAAMDASLPALTISRHVLTRVLAAMVAALALVSLAVPLIRLGYGRTEWLPLLEPLYVGAERSVATWFSAAQLGIAAIGAALLARRRIGQPLAHAGAWWTLSTCLLLVSVDEVATIHERVGGRLEAWFAFDGIFRFAWVVPGVAVALLLACLFVPFLCRLPRTVACRIVIAAIVFLSGALGMEMIGGAFVAEHGDAAMHQSALYASIVIVEESLEMLGVLILIDTLLRCLETGEEDPSRSPRSPVSP